MQVGMAAVFQNPGRARRDFDVYRDDLRLADLVEPLGFDSIWSVEHHFTDYTMCPDVLQFLTYMAGRTTRVSLGSMVVVLPWHDPMRVAEEVSMLDNICGGRFILGLGRGAAKVEFEGFRADIRPAPFKSFRGRTYAAAVSPESMKIMAELGVGILIIPQKPWPEVAKELTEYHALYRQINGAEPPPPISAGWTFCDPDPDRAREQARRWIGGYFRSVLDHYRFGDDHMKTTKGYEYYAKMTDKIHTYGDEKVIDFFVDLQVWGTPEQCYDKILDVRRRVGHDHFVGVFSYAGMPAAEAERNMRLFAAEVMPALQKLEREPVSA